MLSIKQILSGIKADFQQQVEVATSVDAKPAPDTVIVVSQDPPQPTASVGAS